MRKIKFLTLFLSLLLVCACGRKRNENAYTTIYSGDITIVRYYVGKHSRVDGLINFHGLMIPVRNSSSGYYYKKYSLHEGEIIKNQTVTIISYYDGYGIQVYAEYDFNKYLTN